MKKRIDSGKDDIYICKEKIKEILREYNCSIDTDDYCCCWLEDLDTKETVSMGDIG